MPRTPRMDQLEALLADEPDDAFLCYGLAMEHTSAGDDATAAKLLVELIERKSAEPYVPAFLQAGQALMRLGRESDSAKVLMQGIDVAKQAGDLHAMGEMQGLLATVE